MSTTKIDKTDLSARIRALRGATTFVDWAEKLGVDKSAIDRYEKGRSIPGAEFLLKLWIHHQDIDLIEWLTAGKYKNKDNKRKKSVLTSDRRILLSHYDNLAVNDKKALRRLTLGLETLSQLEKKAGRKPSVLNGAVAA